MNNPSKLTMYRFPCEPPALGICALDHDGVLWVNPSIVSEDCHSKPFQARALRFLKVGPDVASPGMVGLVSVLWLKRKGAKSGEELAKLEELEKLVRAYINGSEGRSSLCADVSYPGDPDFVDGLLRALAGTRN